MKTPTVVSGFFFARRPRKEMISGGDNLTSATWTDVPPSRQARKLPKLGCLAEGLFRTPLNHRATTANLLEGKIIMADDVGSPLY